MMRFLVILVISLPGCAHEKSWVQKKTKKGGLIGYSGSDFRDNPKAVVRSFKKSAKKICGRRGWFVVREIIPAPASAVSAARNASRGDARGAAKSTGGVLLHDKLYRSGRMNRQVKVEYGSPLESWNKAEIRCKK